METGYLATIIAGITIGQVNIMELGPTEPNAAFSPTPVKPESWDEYRALWQQAERKQLLTSHPLHLDIELAGNCNLKCSMCWQSGRLDTPLGLMKDDMYKSIIDNGIPAGMSAIKLQSRGESTLHPRLADLAAYAKSAGVRDVQLTTNGIILDKPKKLESLMEAGLDKLIFSIDEQHDESAREIYGDRAPHLPDVVKRTFEMRERKGIKTRIRIQTFAPDGQTQEERLDEIKGIYPDADEYLINLLWDSDVEHDSLADLADGYDLYPCSYLWTRLVVFWNGDVTLCCRDYNCSLKLGNINDNSVEEIWMGERMQELRRAHAEGRRREVDVCKHCDMASKPKCQPDRQRHETFIHVDAALA